MTFRIMTGNYTRLGEIPFGMNAVGISQGVPQWFRGNSDKRLAPSWEMLKLSREEYDVRFKAQLVALDPEQIATELNNSVLLCWEQPIVTACHRRIVSEWLEDALGIVVTEVGFKRSEVPAYEDTPWKLTPKRAPRQFSFSFSASLSL